MQGRLFSCSPEKKKRHPTDTPNEVRSEWACVKLSIKSLRVTSKADEGFIFKIIIFYYPGSIYKCVRNTCLFRGEVAEVGTYRKKQAPPAEG